MYWPSEVRGKHVAALTTSAILLILIALTRSPDGWLTSLCLVPVVAACLVDLWCAAGAGIAAVTLSQVFASVAWIPKPGSILLTISVVCLVELQQVRENLRRERESLRGNQAHLKAQEELQWEWRTFFENTPAAILSADGQGRIVVANPAAHNLLGVEDGGLPGEFLESYLPALASALRIDRDELIIHTITECKGWRPSCAMFMADVWLFVGKTPLGRRLGAVLVDASERLHERERWAIHSSEASSQIAIGAVLHEIRNLSAAASLMHTNLTRVPWLNGNADFEALGNIVKTLSKIASAELRPSEASNGSVDLRSLLDQLRIIIDPWFRESDIRVKWEIAADLPHVWGEKPGLMQLFMNLAQNSNKALSTSDEKQLTISAGMKGDSVVVRFLDTGPGIADPDELFQPFHTGVGIKRLGLYVSRAIAHSMSGDLKCVPVPAGSCFAVELLSLREWQKVEIEYGHASATYENSSRR